MTNFMSNIRHIRPFFTLFATVLALLFSHNVFAQENVAQGVKVVVLDAGHGGCFPGACYGGINEKDINLQVVLKVGELIKKNMPEIKVVYTRTTDMMFSSTLGVDLQSRADVAHRNNGDLFISVHSNAYSKPEVRGTLTLIMGETTGELSRNENALYANNKEELLDMSDEKTATIVRAYIQNLQFTYGEYSEMMARLVQEEYAKAGMANRGVRRQPLKVLYATDMPSILTEIGFMTNAEDLAYISSEKGQDDISQAIFRAVKLYVENVRRMLQLDAPTQKAEKSEKAEKAEKAEKKQPAKSEQAKPAAKPAATVKRYTIQLMASVNMVPLEKLDLKSCKSKAWVLEGAGTAKYKYCYGDFADRTSAQAELENVHKDFPQAYIITYNKQKP